MIGFGSPTEAVKPNLNAPTPLASSSYPAASHGVADSSQGSEDEHRDSLLSSVEPRDLMNYGLIPEFVGRFPVAVSLTTLDKDALVNILTQPKNALVPQFMSLFAMDQV